MNFNQSINQEKENHKSKLLPKTLTALQIYFIAQIVVGIIVTLIALPLGISHGIGFWIYDIAGILGYFVCVLLLFIALIFLSINAKRVGERILDIKMNKSSAIIGGSLLIGLILIGINIAYGVLYNTGTADKMMLYFAIGNMLSAFILGLMINQFDKMLVNVTRYSEVKKGYQFMKIKPLIVTAILWSIGFTIAAPIMFSSTGNITPRVEFIEISNFIGMLIYGIIGLIVIYFMKDKWLKEFKKRAIILSNN